MSEHPDIYLPSTSPCTLCMVTCQLKSTNQEMNNFYNKITCKGSAHMKWLPIITIVIF